MKTLIILILALSACSSFAEVQLVTVDQVFEAFDVNYDTDWGGYNDDGIECSWSFYYDDLEEEHTGEYIVSYVIDGRSRIHRLVKIKQSTHYWHTTLSDGSEKYVEEIGPAGPATHPTVLILKQLGEGKVRLEAKKGEDDLGAHCIVDEA